MSNVDASVIFSALVTILVAAVLGLMVWETGRLAWKRIPITGIIRYDEAHIRFRWICVIYFLAGLGMGWLVDHFAHY